jgi:hypothetical protein
LFLFLQKRRSTTLRTLFIFAWVTWRVSCARQGLLAFRVHLGSPSGFVGTFSFLWFFLFVCLRPVFCVPGFVSFFGLSILDCLFGFLWRLFYIQHNSLSVLSIPSHFHITYTCIYYSLQANCKVGANNSLNGIFKSVIGRSPSWNGYPVRMVFLKNVCVCHNGNISYSNLQI